MKKLFVLTAILTSLGMPALAQWDVSNSIDVMTGKTTLYCSSPVTSPTKPMDWPYNNTQAKLKIGCNSDSVWVYIEFSDQDPNLIDADIFAGYYVHSTRVKWDDDLVNQTFTQTWYTKVLDFNDDKTVIQNIMKSNSLLVELNWYTNGKTYFKFNLAGASEAITEMRAKCK